MSALVTYEPYVDACAGLFSQRLGELADGGVAANMGHWLQCYAFDVIGMITYSKRLGFLDRGEDVEGVIAALEEHLKYASLTGIYPGLHRFLFPLKNYLAGKRGAGRGYVLSFTKDRMAEHQHSPKAIPTEGGEEGGAVDFLTKFVAKHAKDPEEFTPEHTLAGCTSNMVAGSGKLLTGGQPKGRTKKTKVVQIADAGQTRRLSVCRRSCTTCSSTRRASRSCATRWTSTRGRTAEGTSRSRTARG